MTKEQNFFIDIIKLMTVDAVLLIQAPSLEFQPVIDLMKETEFEYYKSIYLNDANKKVLIDATISDDIQDFVHSLEIRENKRLLFEGFDRMEYGEISNQFSLPQGFIEKYIEAKMCLISTTW